MYEKLPLNAIEYDLWATEEVIKRCAELTDAELQKPVDIGKGSVGAALEHLVRTISLTRRILAGEELQRSGPVSEGFVKPAELLRSFHDEGAGLAAIAEKLIDTGKLEEKIVLPWSGASVSKLVFIGNMIEHSMFHRAEIELMLGALGLKAFPQVSVARWASK